MRPDPMQLKTQASAPQSTPTSTLAGPRSLLETPKSSWVSLATPLADVSAFGRMVLLNLIPNNFWGQGELGQQNARVMMVKVDHFVRLRRFENMTLHEACQNIKVASLRKLSIV